MGRSVFIEDSIEDNILRLYGVKKWATGVLIGQPTAQKDYVVHLALTPLQENLDNTEEFESGFSKQQSSSKTPDVGDFDEHWFVQHCRQVNRMLTGGLKMLGIFVFGPPEKRSQLQVKFRQILYMMYKMILSDLPLGKMKLHGGNNEQIILQVCSATKKMTCSSIDVSDSKASVHPADVKYQSFISKWNMLQCSVCLELKFTIEKKTKPGSLYSSLKIGLFPFITNIAHSLATVNGVLMSDDQVLVSEKHKKSSGKNYKKDVFEVSLFLKEIDCEPFIKKKHMTGQIMLVGTLDSQAFVHPKATVKEAVNAIKCDVIRNLITRCQLLCEDLEQETLHGDEREVDQNIATWILPKRMFVPICGGSLKVSDCIFRDEEPKDVLNRLSQLIGISVSEKDLMSGEQFPEYDNYADLLVDTDFQTELKFSEEKEVSQKNSFTKHFIGATLGLVTTIVAAAVAFFYGD